VNKYYLKNAKNTEVPIFQFFPQQPNFSAGLAGKFWLELVTTKPGCGLLHVQHFPSYLKKEQKFYSNVVFSSTG
jgi:hypothetical protein